MSDKKEKSVELVRKIVRTGGTLVKPGEKDVARPEMIPTFRSKPHISTIFGGLYHVSAEFIRNIQAKIVDGQPVDNRDLNMAIKLGEMVIKMSKEEREQDKANDPSQFTDEELHSLIEKAKKVLKEDT